MVRRASVYEPGFESDSEIRPLIPPSKNSSNSHNDNASINNHLQSDLNESSSSDKQMSVIVHPLASVLQKRRRRLWVLFIVLLIHSSISVFFTVILAVQNPYFGINHTTVDRDIDFTSYSFSQSLTDVAFLCCLRPLLIIGIYQSCHSKSTISIVLSAVISTAYLGVKFHYFKHERRVVAHENIDVVEYCLFGTGIGLCVLEALYNWIFIRPLANRVIAARKMWGNHDDGRLSTDIGDESLVVLFPHQGGNVQAAAKPLTHYEDSIPNSPNSYYEDHVVVPPSPMDLLSHKQLLSHHQEQEESHRASSPLTLSMHRPRAQSGYSSASGHSMYHTPDGSPDSHHGFGTPNSGEDHLENFMKSRKPAYDDSFGTPESSNMGSPIPITEQRPHQQQQQLMSQMSLSSDLDCDFGTPRASPVTESLDISNGVQKFKGGAPVTILASKAVKSTVR